MTSLYIHIPFCKQKCSYCDFVSYAGKEDMIEAYVEALCREIKDSPHFNLGSRAHTIFFGGGTPTLLEPKHFDKIISSFICHSEISIEANPGTANKAKLKALRRLGINRLSIGAQSFNDKHLKILGRIHDSKQIFKFYDDARAAGFDNINLDLIFALPNQTLDQWKIDLETAIHLSTHQPDHLSTYNLQIEENTPFSALVPRTQEEELEMYEYTIETLTSHGYKHYEISNFAKPGFECRHNINYWKNGNYIGIGAGAHSHVDGKRWANPDSVEEYISLKPERNREFHSQVPSKSDTIFLGLRMLEGLPADKFNGFKKEATELIESGLLTRENSRIKLTRKGLYLGNEVFEKFI